MSDDRLIEQITERLEASVERLDGATRSHLTQARHRALAARHRPRWLLPAAGGALLASAVAVMVWMGRTPGVTQGYSVSDFEILTSGDTIELYRDMEFLQWLDEKEGNRVI